MSKNPGKLITGIKPFVAKLTPFPTPHSSLSHSSLLTPHSSLSSSSLHFHPLSFIF